MTLRAADSRAWRATLAILLGCASACVLQGQQVGPSEAAAAAVSRPEAKKTPTPIVPPPRCELLLRVVGPDGRPIPRVGVLHASELITQQALDAPTARGDFQGRVHLRLPGQAILKHGRRVLLAASGFASVVVTLSGGERIGTGDAAREVVRRGTVLMRTAMTLRGLVRSAAGKPIVGARVRAVDVLRSGHVGRRPDALYESVGFTDEKGRFRLPGVPQPGATVAIDAPGYFRWRAQHANAFAPVIATLDPGGEVSGKVVTGDGHPFSSTVVAYYAMSDETNEVRADAAGKFVLPRVHPGSYRLVVSDRRLVRDHWTVKRRGSATDVALTLDHQLRPKPAIVVTAVDPAGKVLKDFRAAVAWVPKLAVPKAYLRTQFRALGRDSGPDGSVRLRISARKSYTGFLRVAARGFAPATQLVFRRDDLSDIPVQVQLRPESIIVGKLLHPRTKKPIVGARVSLVDGFRTRSGVTASTRSVRTNQNGEFGVDGLDHGEHKLRFSVEGQPPFERKFNVQNGGALRVGAIHARWGTELRGQVLEAKIGPGWQFQVQKKVEQQQIFLPTSQDREPADPKHRVVLGPDGRFVLAGLPRGRFVGVLRIPYPMGWLEVPVGEVRLNGDKVQERFFAAGRMPGTLRGKVAASGAPLTPGRLLVVAFRESARPMIVRPVDGPPQDGPCAWVRPDGSYELPLPPGRYFVQIQDLATGVVFLRATKPVRIDADAERKRDYEVPLVALRLDVRRSKGGPVTWTHIVIEPALAKNYSTGSARGMWLRTPLRLQIPSAERVVDLIVPAGKTQLTARSFQHQLDPLKSAFNFPPRGRTIIQAKSGVVHRARLDIVR